MTVSSKTVKPVSNGAAKLKVQPEIQNEFYFERRTDPFMEQPQHHKQRPVVKWYRVIERDNTPGPFLDIDQMEGLGSEPERFYLKTEFIYQGKYIEDWTKQVVFRASEHTAGERADDALCTFNMVPVYSKRLQEAILSAGIKDFQFLPCQVINARGDELFGYAIANVLQMRNAFSLEHGRALYINENLAQPFVAGNVKHLSKVALKFSEIQNCDALRIPEFKRKLFVSSSFVKAYKSIRATGISFGEALIVD